MPNLLLVDDIAGVHEMLDYVFEETEFELLHAHLAQQAIEIYQSKPVDVVLCDIQMPGMDGLELFKELKQIDPAVTVVLTTASESRDYVIQALRLGAFDYVEKPYDEAKLIETMQRALGERYKRLADTNGRGDIGSVVDSLKKELAEHKAAIEETEQKDAEIAKLKQELKEQKTLLSASEKKRKELDRQRMELEVREGALKTMESVLKERMDKLKSSQKQQGGIGISAKDSARLAELQASLAKREAELQEMEAGIQERESFITETEESLMEKGMRLQELEAELEQMREDLSKDGGGSGGVSLEAQKEMEAMQAKVEEKEKALSEMEQKMREKERSIKKAEALIKAREQFLAQSEAILLGEEQA